MSRSRPGSEAGEPPVASELVMFRAGRLIPIDLPCPDEASGPGKAIAAKTPREIEARPARAMEDVRTIVGHNLRWAFPLPESGSFHQLLAALEDA
jgi:hypothetical protein